MLVTWTLITDRDKPTFLLRLGRQYAVGEVYRYPCCKGTSAQCLQGLALRKAHSNAAFQQYKAELKVILGVNNITGSCLTDALQQRNLSPTGLKHKKAERLVSYHRILRDENLTAAPLYVSTAP
jgi:hypothetical protein